MSNHAVTQSNDTLSPRYLFSLFWSKRAVFVVALLLTLTLAFLYTSFTKPVYRAYTTLFIKDESQSYFRTGHNELLQGFGLFSGIKNMQNEMVVLQSHAVMRETIQRLGLHVGYYYSPPLGRSVELYTGSPFLIEIDSAHAQLVGIDFNLNFLKKDRVLVSFSTNKAWTFDYQKQTFLDKHLDLDFEKEASLGEWIETPYMRFRIRRIEKKKWTDKHLLSGSFFFRFSTLKDIVRKAQASLSLTVVNKKASVVRLSIETYNLKKAKDVLNMLTQVYLERGLKKKNRIAVNTIRYIDSQLQQIRDSLSVYEEKVQAFRKKQRLWDLPFQAQAGLDQMQELEKERIENRLKLDYLTYLSKEMERPDEETLTLPVALGQNDQLISQLVVEYTRLQNQQQGFANTGAENPFALELKQKISNAKKTLEQAVSTALYREKKRLQSLNRRFAEIDNVLMELPRQQAELLELERLFSLNNQLYTFLLQKRAEAQIARASNTSDNEVIDEALQWGKKPIRPKKKIVYLLACIFAFMVPGALLLLLDYLDDSVQSKNDIAKISNVPVIAAISRSTMLKQTVVFDYPKSATAESFRALRTNLQFYGHGDDKLTILVTSSLAGEGKTFTATNLALTYAAYGKTVLVGFDLRRPRIYNDFNLTNELGVSNFLIGREKLEAIVQKTKLPTLDIITSGPTPPNPVELIDSEQTNSFVSLLKSRYEYIIMDTAPVGLVTDAYLLMKYTDSNLYIVRQNYTKKQELSHILEEVEQKGIKRMSVVLNDVERKAYGNNYYDDSPQIGWFDRFRWRKT